MLRDYSKPRVRPVRQSVLVDGISYLCSGWGGWLSVFREEDAVRIGSVHKVRRAWWEPYGPGDKKLGSHHRTMSLAVEALVRARS